MSVCVACVCCVCGVCVCEVYMMDVCSVVCLYVVCVCMWCVWGAGGSLSNPSSTGTVPPSENQGVLCGGHGRWPQVRGQAGPLGPGGIREASAPLLEGVGAIPYLRRLSSLCPQDVQPQLSCPTCALHLTYEQSVGNQLSSI